MTQNEKLLQHLQLGNTISPLEASGIYGINRLAARVHELKKRGHKIVRDLRKDPTGKTYARYRLER